MKINKVIMFTNGVVLAFDKDGEQLPEFQRDIFNMEEIFNASSKDTDFYISSFGEWIAKLDLKWIFEETKNK